MFHVQYPRKQISYIRIGYTLFNERHTSLHTENIWSQFHTSTYKMCKENHALSHCKAFGKTSSKHKLYFNYLAPGDTSSRWMETLIDGGTILFHLTTDWYISICIHSSYIVIFWPYNLLFEVSSLRIILFSQGQVIIYFFI